MSWIARSSVNGRLNHNTCSVAEVASVQGKRSLRRRALEKCIFLAISVDPSSKISWGSLPLDSYSIYN